MTIKEIQQEIVDEFSMFDDWMDKYAHIITLGEELEALQEEYKVEQNLISGCQSKVWMKSSYDDGKVSLRADSDAIITKGIAALLVRAFGDQSPEEIVGADLAFLDEIGLQEHLSQTRSNGLLAMIKQIKMDAAVYSKLKGL